MLGLAWAAAAFCSARWCMVAHCVWYICSRSDPAARFTWDSEGLTWVGFCSPTDSLCSLRENGSERQSSPVFYLSIALTFRSLQERYQGGGHGREVSPFLVQTLPPHSIQPFPSGSTSLTHVYTLLLCPSIFYWFTQMKPIVQWKIAPFKLKEGGQWKTVKRWKI